jgi:ferredoxin-like protein FixX
VRLKILRSSFPWSPPCTKKRTIFSTEDLQHLSTEDAPYGDLTTEPTPPLLALLTACPARCCELNDKGQVEIMADGCVEYGTAG